MIIEMLNHSTNHYEIVIIRFSINEKNSFHTEIHVFDSCHSPILAWSSLRDT